MTTIKSLAKKEVEQLDSLKTELTKMFEALSNKHQNSKIKRIKGHTNCFIINKSDLGDNWTPEYHDFQVQYELLISKLSNCASINQFFSFIEKCIKTKKIDRTPTDKVSVHPEVLDKLKLLL